MGSYGYYNAYNPPPPPRKRGMSTIMIGALILIGVIALSPGARHYYRHGHLPPAAPPDDHCA